MSLSTSICMDILFCIDLYLETNCPVAERSYWLKVWKTAHSSLLADLKQQQQIPFCARQQMPLWSVAITFMNHSERVTLGHLDSRQLCTLGPEYGLFLDQWAQKLTFLLPHVIWCWLEQKKKQKVMSERSQQSISGNLFYWRTKNTANPIDRNIGILSGRLNQARFDTK